jgi:threo-3-hydroxy-L-aspartate ammonia-lyase
VSGLDRGAVVAAAERLAGLVHRTPVLRNDALDAIAGARLWLKCENLQRIGAFKARGALHAVGRLDPDARARGVITYSSGNHAQAVALAARHHGVAADLAMPEDAPAVKVAAVRALGARIVFAGRTSPERRRAALDIQARTGGVIVEPFDDADIIAGQGTATLELLAQVAEAGAALDAILVPVGGGGLVAGACLAAEGSGTAIIAVEPVGCDALHQSLAAGALVDVEPGPTLADGLKPTRIGELNFAVIRPRIAGSVVVDDGDIGRALVHLLLAAKVLAEPSGAAALSAALRGRLPGSPRNVGIIVSGGNVAPALVTELLARYAEHRGDA